jgi:hypothetical protein
MYGGLTSSDESLISYRQHASNQIGARRLSLSMMRSRVTSSRAQRNALKPARAEQLLAFVESRAADTASDVVATARRKVEHEHARMNFSPTRIARLPAILGEMIRGHYRSVGRGIQGAFLDLVQPEGEVDR